ncbi:efflux RND transporter periplasmic adaptor subunit [Aromatoleum aromaticum]|uniref:Similar to efflux transporter n=1 Tax=Aromatoleum aromaticum (strain DSM 19018 / LMG 30748 / EbN1) TaxID=76114 RepID=Q5NZ17_AROAE|nr:efflux RND transporter periplasmic adaptor subunit [Aromatoleum aromaticum]NMG55600.1 efflux RND transporter periplasmic adaptor subunit [Aromatoleum aromaticum]CAI09697.1 similar to efflux transporter [Aromatoleum aromaticum EbN1]
MRRLPLQGRTLALVAVIVPLLALFIYVALRSGPLAPVSVTLASVETRPVTPALFGIGTVQTRYTYRIGPTFAGRVKRLDVHVGDRVKAGQVLGEMDPVDLDQRIRAQGAALKRAEAALREAAARQNFARSQARRYEQLFAVRTISEELATTKHQELQIADAALSGAREELLRARSDGEALVAQRNNLRLVAPVDGLVAVRDVDPGTTIVAGQPVVEVIAPESLWINTRFDQISASGLAAGLPARVVLRSRNGQALTGRVLRVEPMADAVTEETLAKVAFDSRPEPLPPIGELAEVTVALPALPAAPVIPNAAVRREAGQVGVWKIVDGDARFTPVKLGAGDLDGHVQVLEGVRDGEQVVVYSEKALTAGSRIHVVDDIPGVPR